MSGQLNSYDFAVNGRRTLRFVWVGLCNGCLFVAGVESLLPTEEIVWRVFGAIVCIASVTGIVLELLKHRLAQVVNVATPTLVAVVMATSIKWIPILAAYEGHPGDADEGAIFLLIFSLVPLCFALITGVAYWVIDIEPDRSSTRLGLQ